MQDYAYSTEEGQPPAALGSELLTPFAELFEQMPTGITVAPDGRKFLCFPRWFAGVKYTVGELLSNKTVIPYPNLQTNALDLCDAAHHFVSVQSLVASDEATLWVLDTGRPWFAPALDGARKLVEVDLHRGLIRRSYEIPHGIAHLGTYLNDMRFDFRRGAAGTAYITDSATFCPGAIIVVDLATGDKIRRLNGHFSVQPQPNGTPTIQGIPLRVRLPLGVSLPYKYAADGIALSPDGATLYYCPLSSRKLYSVDAALLADPGVGDEEVANSVRDLGEKSIADGLACDSAGRVYAGDLENNCIWRRDVPGKWTMLVQDARMIWTDSLSIAADGYLYHTANQINRMGVFNSGRDCRVPPYYVFRTQI
jgi:sugar lactone lactonase YvrE